MTCVSVVALRRLSVLQFARNVPTGTYVTHLLVDCAVIFLSLLLLLSLSPHPLPCSGCSYAHSSFWLCLPLLSSCLRCTPLLFYGTYICHITSPTFACHCDVFLRQWRVSFRPENTVWLSRWRTQRQLSCNCMLSIILSSR